MADRSDYPRDPRPGRDLPRCVCGEEVAVPHAECLAMVDGVYSFGSTPISPEFHALIRESVAESGEAENGQAGGDGGRDRDD